MNSILFVQAYYTPNSFKITIILSLAFIVALVLLIKNLLKGQELRKENKRLKS